MENEAGVVVVRYEELDDHGHSTLVFHGEPEVVAEIMGMSLLILGAGADSVTVVDPDGDEGLLELTEGEGPDLAEAA